MQYMAQMLLNTDDPNILAQAPLALDEANEAANNSCIRITGFRKRLESYTQIRRLGASLDSGFSPRVLGTSLICGQTQG